MMAKWSSLGALAVTVGALLSSPAGVQAAERTPDRCKAHACSVTLQVPPGEVITYTTPQRWRTDVEALEVHVRANGTRLSEDFENLSYWRFYGRGVAVHGYSSARRVALASFLIANAAPWPRRVRITWRRWWVGR